jgi:hypothetical protein
MTKSTVVLNQLPSQCFFTEKKHLVMIAKHASLDTEYNHLPQQPVYGGNMA